MIKIKLLPTLLRIFGLLRCIIAIISNTKKRDCTIAVPLVKALALPFHPNNNTEAHAVCIHVRLRVSRYYIPMGILCCNVLGKSLRTCEILTSQNKALKTPFSICPYPSHYAKGHIP